MAVAKMKLVNIVGRLKDFDKIVQNCCIKGDFHPEQSSTVVENIEKFAPIEEQNPYEKAMQKAVDIGVHSDIALRYSNFDKLVMSFSDLSSFIEKTETEINRLNGVVSDLKQKSTKLEQILTQLSHIQNFDINLDEIFGCKHITFQFGRLPKESYIKLNTSDENDEMIFFPLEEDNLYYWGFYVVRNSDRDRYEEFFNSLYFERINISDAHGTPKEASVNISENLKSVGKQLDEAIKDVKKYWGKNETIFLKVYSNIRYLHDSFDLRKFASKVDDYFYIFGWVAEKDIDRFQKQFEKLPDVDCIVEKPEEAENIEPPTNLVNNKIVKPFEMFVGMYGLPVYNEIDPTPFLALTYSIIFGIMFGDLGQGAVVFVLGLYLWFKRKINLGAILYRIGISSMIFGTLYNSVFGYEDVLPFTILPVHKNQNVMFVLGGTIAFGVLIILTCMIFNIINGAKQKDVGKMLFSQNGIAGLVFYISILLACVFTFLLNKNIFSPVFIILLIILPLLLMALKEPLLTLIKHKKEKEPSNLVESFVQTFFEMFEILLSYATNTVSFVRVGAYILSHAGMMTAVFALSNLGGHGNIAVVVIGNVFVMVIEGFVVAIQGIRLQYYEIFSRFFNGTGKQFDPIKIHYE